MHILRLRGKLGWQTKLPSCELLAREADVSRLQKFTLMMTFTFPSPHPVQLYILEMMLVINVKYLFPGSLCLLKRMDLFLESRKCLKRINY